MLLPVVLVLMLGAPTKVAVSEFQAGLGADPKLAHLVTTFVVSELRKNSGLSVTSQEDLQSLLGFQKQRQLLACADTTCLAEIGGALGVEEIVTGSLSKLGESVVVVLRVVDVHHAKVLRDVDRRLTGSKEDAVLDVVPEMVNELFPRAEPPKPAPPAAVTPPVEAQPSAVVQVAKPSTAPYWLAGAGGLLALVGGGLIVGELVQGQPSTSNGVTTYGITSGQAGTANTVGAVGEIAAGVGLGVLLGGLGWALLRPSPQPAPAMAVTP